MADRVPKYMQVERYIKNLIATGAVEEGERLPPERDLAKQLDMSIGTVKSALKNLAMDGVIYREQGRGTFVTPQQSHNTGGMPQADTVGIIVPDIFISPFCSSIIRGLEDMLQDERMYLAVRTTENRPECFLSCIDSFLAEKVKGIVLYPLQGSDAQGVNTEGVHRVSDEGIPLVLVDRLIEGVDVSSVTTDNFYGGYRITKHLLELGHRRIAFVADAVCSAILDRLDGFKKALSEFGVRADDALIMMSELRLDAAGCEGVQRLMKSEDTPTALVCVNDPVARGAYYELRRRGIRVPQDVALVGYANDDFAEDMEIPLTTVDQPAYRMGMESGRLLLQKIKGISDTNRQVVLESRVIVRESCGARVKDTLSALG